MIKKQTPIQLLLHIATSHCFCPVEMKYPDVVVHLVDSVWPTQPLRLLFLLVPGDFWGMPWKGDVFNGLYLTRLGINLLVNLSCSTWNNRTGGDVTFLVGEQIKGACLQPSPWTPKGISGCQVSLDSTGRGRERREARANSLDILHKMKVFQPTSNSILCTSLRLAF